MAQHKRGRRHRLSTIQAWRTAGWSRESSTPPGAANKSSPLWVAAVERGIHAHLDPQAIKLGAWLPAQSTAPVFAPQCTRIDAQCTRISPVHAILAGTSGAAQIPAGPRDGSAISHLSGAVAVQPCGARRRRLPGPPADPRHSCHPTTDHTARATGPGHGRMERAQRRRGRSGWISHRVHGSSGCGPARPVQGRPPSASSSQNKIATNIRESNKIN